eukprot:TRINITY_DN8597_c0_g1_i1.p1 TRINITY_DN8597_c0_g1~~TRINITY_DN8597_c0_g1_i1.p1  ORF type:complete len:418 (-),score=166.75 TRINITY_DN8597_c0_g1_i1:9-1262(-)
MLNQTETNLILNILNDQQKTIEIIIKAAQKKELFKLCYGICTLLQLNILNLNQRLVSYLLMVELHRTETLQQNPFLPILIIWLNKPDLERIELCFLLHLLSIDPLTREFMRKTPIEAANEIYLIYEKNKDKDFQIERQNLTKDLTEAYSNYLKQLPEVSSFFHKTSIWPPAIPDPIYETDLNNKKSNDLDLYVEELSPIGFELPYTRLIPPLLPLFEQEPILFGLDVEDSKLVFEHLPFELSNNPFRCLETAIKSTLTEPQKIELQQLIEKNDESFLIIVTPQKLPNLIENNPSIAVDVMLKLMNSSVMPHFLAALVDMKITLHLMEVVNKLTMHVELPKEFVHMFITNCFTACDEYVEKFSQNRLVRLVSVFLQSLVRNKIISCEELKMELTEFCLKFNKIKDVSVLYRLCNFSKD